MFPRAGLGTVACWFEIAHPACLANKNWGCSFFPLSVSFVVGGYCKGVVSWFAAVFRTEVVIRVALFVAVFAWFPIGRVTGGLAAATAALLLTRVQCPPCFSILVSWFTCVTSIFSK